MARLRLATRASPLARLQAESVAARLRTAEAELSVELVVVSTHGDEHREVPLAAIGGEGAFSVAVDRAVAEGRADVAVHSAKDLPSIGLDPALELAAVPERADPRDCLVGGSLAGLAPGAAIATGSVRRRAQLAGIRPDLVFVELRGNIATRLERVPPGGAVVVALAALERLGIGARATEVLSIDEMLPQVGQGALALTCRRDDAAMRERLAAIDVDGLHRAVRAERAFLARLGAGCEWPVGAYGTLEGDRIALEGLVSSPDGTRSARERLSGADPERLGAALADALSARGEAAGIGGLRR